MEFLSERSIRVRLPALRNRPPVTIVAYLAIVAVALVAALLDAGTDPRVLFGIAFFAATAYGLLGGVWWVWLVLTVLQVLTLLGVVIDWPAWWLVAFNAVLLALLLSRPTRSYTRRRPAPARSPDAEFR